MSEGTAPLYHATGLIIFYCSPPYGYCIESIMFKKTIILRSHQSIHEIIRDLLPGHILPVSIIKKYTQRCHTIAIENRALFTKNTVDIFNGYFFSRMKHNQVMQHTPGRQKN